MTRSITLKNAWLLTWRVFPPRRGVEEIVAILSSRKSDHTVAEIVELLYQRATSSAFDMAYCANRRKEMPHRAQNQNGQILCGSNKLWLYARRVTKLKIRADEEDEKEILSWVEPPEHKFKDYEIVEIIEGEKKYLERKHFSPLSNDILD